MINSSGASKKVVIVGASGFGRECLDVLEAMIEAGEKVEVVGVLDDSPSLENLDRLQKRKVKYLGKVDNYLRSIDRGICYLIGIGDPRIRELIAEKFDLLNLQAFSAIHPKSSIGSQIDLQPGVVICSGVTISTNVTLGRHVHLNPNVIIGHDSILKNFVSVNPGGVISGEVVVEKGVLVGATALILQQLRIGEKSTIGAGAVVTRRVPSSVVVKGIPGRWNEE